MNKQEAYSNSLWEEIIRNSNEVKAFSLGVANTYYQFYKYYKTIYDETELAKLFKSAFEGNEMFNVYFRKYIEFDETPMQNTDGSK